MKAAAKVFIILGMVFGAILIFPLILGIFALRSLDNAKTKDELGPWPILILLFVSLIGGIFMLCITDEQLNEGNENVQNTENKKGNAKDTLSNIELIEKLGKMKQEGLITEEEFNEKKKELLK